MDVTCNFVLSVVTLLSAECQIPTSFVYYRVRVSHGESPIPLGNVDSCFVVDFSSRRDYVVGGPADGRVKLDLSLHIRGGFYRQLPKTKLARVRHDSLRELVFVHPDRWTDLGVELYYHDGERSNSHRETAIKSVEVRNDRKRIEVVFCLVRRTQAGAGIEAGRFGHRFEVVFRGCN